MFFDILIDKIHEGQVVWWHWLDNENGVGNGDGGFNGDVGGGDSFWGGCNGGGGGMQVMVLLVVLLRVMLV